MFKSSNTVILKTMKNFNSMIHSSKLVFKNKKIKYQSIFTLVLAWIVATSTYAQVSIGTTTPESSAMLELSSTSQGFLPPRLTYDQRLNIPTTPIATGLMIWCSDCGHDGQIQVFNGQIWTNMAGGLASVPPSAVGDFRDGGVVFYVDPEDNTHGLICAIEDQSTGIQWYNGTNMVTNADGILIGTGKANTELIIAAQGPTETDYAAGLARAYRGGGYSDWFLPSKQELNHIRIQMNYINATAQAHGGDAFVENDYWSSTEESITQAFRRSFIFGDDNGQNKSSKRHVRAVRTF